MYRNLQCCRTELCEEGLNQWKIVKSEQSDSLKIYINDINDINDIKDINDII